MSTRTTKSLFIAALAVALLLTGLLGTPSEAAAFKKLQLAGTGTASVPVEGAATFEGSLSGTPISGPYVGRLEPADGSLPSPGTCEEATARLYVHDGAGAHVELFAPAGQVCSIWLPLGTMQAFDGHFDVVSTSERRLRRADGPLQVRLLGQLSDVYAIGG
jgi:hypothetical protein